ncbi:hypothetical protein [Streptomyces malaysiensis]
MSTREPIASLLWWQVPSANDTEAKVRANELLDAFTAEERAAALSDAADEVESLLGEFEASGMGVHEFGRLLAQMYGRWRAEGGVAS